MTTTKTPPRERRYIRLRRPHPKQAAFIDSKAKRKVVRAGRRGGKTTGIAIYAADRFAKRQRRILYAVPTSEQLHTFWFEIKRALREPLELGYLYKNESEHIIEVPDTKQRIRAKTAWNADTLRGDYADDLILDEFQLMSEDAWEDVGQPMLLDNNGDAVFIYTPRSLFSKSVTKARDPMHAAKLYKAAQNDASGLWETFHFSSHDNPHISTDALEVLASDMSARSYRQEIMAEDSDIVPGALWTMPMIEDYRKDSHPDLQRVVVSIDPAVTADPESDETGIIVAGRGVDDRYYVVADRSCRLLPDGWAKRAIRAYEEFGADRVVAEVNNGGKMVRYTLQTIDPNVAYREKSASRGKAIRAEPISALYEQGRVSHVGQFPELEEQMVMWSPASGESPDRLDALVWALTELSDKPEIQVL